MTKESLQNRFDADYRSDFGDKVPEEYYPQDADESPAKAKYEDVKFPLPTRALRVGIDDEDIGYLKFCDQVEEALICFIESLDDNRSNVQKPLTKLINELNSIGKVTDLMGAKEVRELYSYIAEILNALGNPQLIKSLDSLRRR